jgi:redox-sensitive bicupin YhaK (pirin superfamily)
MMPLHKLRPASVAHPFGDERTVQQAFPGAINEKEADPFLMCDYFNLPSSGPVSHPDDFPVDWHPHRGMDILSYLRTGVGRHGDSLGNRETFESPGMQWMSVGSGVEHGEGGGTPKGETTQGFQIWLNVPSKDKMLDPIYGTEAPEDIPQTQVAPGAMARLLAGPMGDRVGAFKSKAFVQVIDFDLEPGAAIVHEIPTSMDTCILFVYEGDAVVAGQGVARQSVVQLDASSDDVRGFQLTAGPSGPVSAILFAGKRLNEPISWHGPIVMNTKTEIEQTFQELRSGNFPPVRVDWDYRRIATRPK